MSLLAAEERPAWHESYCTESANDGNHRTTDNTNKEGQEVMEKRTCGILGAVPRYVAV